jgi:hypothetical protein
MSKLLVDEISDADNTGPVTVTDGAVVNRTGNGTIIDLQSGGTTVGSIGTKNGALHIGSTTGSDSYLGFYSNQIIPTTSDGSDKNAVTDLGYSGSRFKDLYLSGGVYLGGTGAANHLDDYEEGVFLPFTGIGSGYTGEVLENAQYTKIGRMVYINLRMKWTGTDGVGNPAVFIMPFTHATATATGTTGAIMYSGTQLRSGAALIAHMATNSNELYIYSGAGGAFSALTRAEFNGAYDLAISFCYYVA